MAAAVLLPVSGIPSPVLNSDAQHHPPQQPPSPAEQPDDDTMGTALVAADGSDPASEMNSDLDDDLDVDGGEEGAEPNSGKDNDIRDATLEEVLDQVRSNWHMMMRWQRRKLLKVARTVDKRRRRSHKRPGSTPMKNWVPIDLAKSLEILDKIAEGRSGVRRAKVETLDPGAWPIKILSKELKDDVASHASTQEDMKKQMALMCVMTSSLLSRVFEEAAVIMEGEGANVETLMVHQISKQGAGFANSKGTGVALTEEGHTIFRRAALVLRARLATATAAVVVPPAGDA